MITTRYDVAGMTCGHCESSVRQEVAGVAGVKGVDVSATTGQLIVTSAAAVEDVAILEAVREAGYSSVRVP